MRCRERQALAVALALLVVPTTTDLQSKIGDQISWETNCSYSGNNYRLAFGSVSKCANICVHDLQCTHWTWKTNRGGTCWLKKGDQLAKSIQRGSKCGVLVFRDSDKQFQHDAPAHSSRVPSSSGLTTTEMSEMLRRINAYRTQNSLRALTMNKQLVAAAYFHSRDQAKRCTMTHTGSNGSHLSDRILNQGYDYSTVAENVAAGQTSVESVMTDWWNSPGHRANLLNKNITNVGFAKVVNHDCDKYATYWTQDFGVPM